ncbi:MAG: aminotransferase class IV [Planctomycetota bacterium]|nr:aminotransferase class IV [Planctomycetota bacterium]
MAETVWINGRFVARDEARVSAFDAGLLHSVGLFETMLAAPLAADPAGTRGRVVRIHQHMERLERSARALGLTESLKVRALQELVEHVVERSGELGGEGTEGAEGRARVRLTITGGDLNLLASTAKSPVEPTVMIHVQPATRYPAEMFESGVVVGIAGLRSSPMNPFEGHKTIHYWPRLSELRRAAGRGAAEALVLQVTGRVGGGTVSNAFLVKDGRLITPLARGEEARGGGEDDGEGLPSPVLPGVTRGAILEMAEELGVTCERRAVESSELLSADEVFLTNCSWGVLPVRQIESRLVGEGRPGELTGVLRERWLEMVRDEP